MCCKDRFCTILDLDQVLFAKFEDFGDWYKIIITFRQNIKTDLVYRDLYDANNDYNVILKHIIADREEGNNLMSFDDDDFDDEEMI